MVGGPLNKLLKRPETQVQRDLQNSIVVTATHGGLLPDTEQDISQKKDLAFDTLYIEDEEVRSLLYTLMMEDVTQIKFDEEGNVEFMRDQKGELVYDGNHTPVPKYVRGQKIKLYWAAVYALCNRVASLEIVRPVDLPLYRIDIDEVIDDAIDKLSEHEVQEGAITLLCAIRSILYRQLDDSVNGNKLKIMRELRISKELGLKVNQKDKKGVM